MFTKNVSLSSLLVLVVASLGVASGEPQEVPDRWRETHCVMFVVDQRDDGELIMSEPECFLDEASAGLRAVEGHMSWYSAGTESGTAMASSSVLGRHYQGANGSGSSVTVVGSSCSGGHWNTGSAWANKISSSYNGCQRLRHWDLPNKGGASENTYGLGTIKNLNSLNNRTESVSYHSS